ncbi:hypothetical protein [Vallitalea maricola]|uniref:Uncharacterized protein n=1 Tax=Vallitalea maricola TaxID=3074433 RepID=A0ACB5UD41_9FIRM|nr:hypothetical protein AN2V17_00780 [Vallitalea sp. AN17-2]
MKNLKKVFALVLSLAMIVSTFTVSFAAEDTKTDAEICEALGMLKGEGDGVTDEYLAKSTTRFQAALMVLRLQNLEEEALAFEGTETFADAEDVQWVAGRSVLAYLKANPELGWLGDGENFDPNGAITAQAYYKVMLEAIGYKQGTDFEWADVLEFAAEKGLKAAADVENFTNNEIAVVTVETLKAETKEGKKLVDVLVEAGAIDEAKAVEVGLVEAAPSEVAIKGAVALNSKVVEVTLKEAAEEVNASQFVIADKDGAAVEIASAELAPWDANNKKVLVTLATDTKSGELYSVTSGEVSVNFGGRGEDASNPTLAKSTGADYNEFTLEFSEAVRIDTLKIAAAEKYGSKAALEVLGYEYIDSKTIKVMTADQAGSKLYGLTVSGAVDLAGNEMKEDSDNTFVGKAKPTVAQKVKKAKAIDYNQVYVEFETNIDPASIADATFAINEMYGSKAEVAVLEVAQATEAQTVEYGTADVAADKAAAVKKGVVLTVDGTMKTSSLYKVVANGMKTLYGKDMSSTSSDKETTFVGMSKPSGTFAYDGDITVASASSIKVKFARKLEKDLAEDIANYTINEAYGNKAELAVLAAELQADQKTVKLTVGEMKNVLYKVTTSNLMDIYGNAQKTGSDAEKTFVGQGKEAKISSITSITRIDDTNIKVTFNHKVGENATDVALYTIDGGVGYPEAVATYSDDANSVKLTIAKTTETVSYKLTVKGLNNADGVAMDADGVTGTFTGKGIAKGLPVLQAVVATDKQTAKFYFDRDVTDSTIKGTLWAVTGTDDVANFFMTRENKQGTSLASLNGLKAYQDSTDKNVLVVVDDNESWNTGNDFTTYVLDLEGSSFDGKKVKFDTNITQLEVAANGSTYAYPTVEAVQGIDSKTIKVYFSKPVTFGASGITTIAKTSDSSATVTEGTPVVVNGTSNKEWLVPISSGTMESVSYTITFASVNVADKYVPSIKLSNKTSEPDTSIVREFAGNGTTTNYITNVYAIMTDNKTIDVYYPEAMKYSTTIINNVQNGSNVDNTGNYTFTVSAGTAPTVTYVAYDNAKNKATLYLNNEFDSNLNTFDLVVNTNIANITGNKTVAKSSSDNANLAIEVAKNTSTTNKGPAIASASVAGDRMSITVGMDQVTAVGTTVAVDDDSNTILESGKLATKKTATSTATVNSADFEKVFKLTTTFEGETTATTITNANFSNYISSVDLSANGKTFTITLKKAIKAGAEGTITTKTSKDNSVSLWGYAGEKRLQNDNESKLTFAAPNSNTFDYTPPTVLNVDSAAGVYKEGSNIDIVLTFNEAVTISDANKDSKIVITVGTTDRDAVLVANTATTATFRYTVVANETDTDGIDVKDDSLTLGSGDSIKDGNGNDLTLTSLNATPLTSVKVDTTAPTCSIQDGTANAPILRFSEPLYKDGVALTDNQVITSLFTFNNVSAGADTPTMTATYTTANNDITFALANMQDTDTIVLASGVVLTDEAGNAVTVNTLTLTNGTPSTWQ